MRQTIALLLETSSKVPPCVCRLAMKESKGRMNPGVMNKMLAEKLKG